MNEAKRQWVQRHAGCQAFTKAGGFMGWIFVLALIVFLVCCNITLCVSIDDETRLELRYICFKLWDSYTEKKPKKPKKTKKKKKDEEEKKQNPLEKIQNTIDTIQQKIDKITGKKNPPVSENHKKKPAVTEILYLVLDLVKAVIPSTKKLLKGVRITDIDIDMSIAEENADKTAMTFTLISASIQNTLVHLGSLIKVRTKNINIRPDFTTEEWQQKIFFKVKIPVRVIISSVWGMIVSSIKVFIKRK